MNGDIGVSVQVVLEGFVCGPVSLAQLAKHERARDMRHRKRILVDIRQ